MGCGFDWAILQDVESVCGERGREGEGRREGGRKIEYGVMYDMHPLIAEGTFITQVGTANTVEIFTNAEIWICNNPFLNKDHIPRLQFVLPNCQKSSQEHELPKARGKTSYGSHGTPEEKRDSKPECAASIVGQESCEESR